jgi:hypothetical protein
MAEVRVQIPDDVIQQLQSKMGTNVKLTDIARDAFTLFNWAVEERSKGRVVLSSSEDGDNINRLKMPSLESVRKLTA